MNGDGEIYFRVEQRYPKQLSVKKNLIRVTTERPTEIVSMTFYKTLTKEEHPLYYWAAE